MSTSRACLIEPSLELRQLALSPYEDVFVHDDHPGGTNPAVLYLAGTPGRQPSNGRRARFLFFHDVFKSGEIVTFAQYLTGGLRIPALSSLRPTWWATRAPFATSSHRALQPAMSRRENR